MTAILRHPSLPEVEPQVYGTPPNRYVAVVTNSKSPIIYGANAPTVDIAIEAWNDWVRPLVEMQAEVERLRAELNEASPLTECARCKGQFRLHRMVPEEGNEWECWPCNERENERERAALADQPEQPT